MRRVTLMLMTMLLGASALPASSLKDIIKPGVVDMTRLFDEYASKSKAAQDLREKKAKFAAEVRQQAELIKKMEQELKGLLAGMSDSEKRRRIAEIEFKKAELTRLIAQRNNELATEEKDLSKPILKDIYEAIRAGDASEAGAWMRRHVHDFRRGFERLGKDLEQPVERLYHDHVSARHPAGSDGADDGKDGER